MIEQEILWPTELFGLERKTLSLVELQGAVEEPAIVAKCMYI
jgi:hypothetical protein